MKPWQDRLAVATSLRSDNKKYIGGVGINPTGRKASPLNKCVRSGDNKICGSIQNAIEKTGLKDGMTISFHHHFRSGDMVLNQVMDVVAEMGIKDLTIVPSSLLDVHAPLVDHIKNGVVTKIHTSGIRGKLAEEISGGLMDEPVVIRSHGGRARAIESGEVHIDVAFLGASSCDEYGNANGVEGKAKCGSMGYAMVDAGHADHVVVITDTIVEYPNMPASLTQQQVDLVVQVDKIGDPNKISSGATRFTKNPKELQIARTAANVIQASSYFKDGFSYQTGSGGASLAVTRFLKSHMEHSDIKMQFALGGITQPMVELYKAGYIKHMFDTQTFDVSAIESIQSNQGHYEISASQYANMHSKGSVTTKLDVVVLSALEIDKNFNVNVMTASDGTIMGASGGHSDTAACAKMTVIVAPLVRGRIPTVVEEVQTIITPGSSVDVLVTERGVAVNPARQDLKEVFMESGIQVVEVEYLMQKAIDIVGKPAEIPYTDKVVGVVEYRDGTWMDVIYGVNRNGRTDS